MPDAQPSVQHVFLRSLGILDRVIACDATGSSLSSIMKREVRCASRDLDAEQLARIMLRERIGCMPVVDDRGRPVGMVTKQDLLERLVSIDGGLPSGLAAHRAADIMMPLTIALDQHAGVAHAAALMSVEDIHHMLVVDADGTLVGIVTSADIVRYLARTERLVG